MIKNKSPHHESPYINRSLERVKSAGESPADRIHTKCPIATRGKMLVAGCRSQHVGGKNHGRIGDDLHGFIFQSNMASWEILYKWKLLGAKIIELNGEFSIAIFDISRSTV